jgi:hypothetical protein
MKQILLTLILVLSLLTISSATQQPKPQQWEYKVMVKKCNDEKTLNALGAESWEITTYSTWALSAGSVDTCVFKRAK